MRVIKEESDKILKSGFGRKCKGTRENSSKAESEKKEKIKGRK